MAFVKIRDNESLEKALKRFKKKVEDEGILKEFKDRQYYKKPSVVKREKNKEAIRKTQIKAKQDARKNERGR
ncbi:MAG: 30S ribosomal protein S21 [bacterium]